MSGKRLIASDTSDLPAFESPHAVLLRCIKGIDVGGRCHNVADELFVTKPRPNGTRVG